MSTRTTTGKNPGRAGRRRTDDGPTFTGGSLPNIPPPPLRLLACEVTGLVEAASFTLRRVKLKKLPRGDGHAVLVIPGFGMHDLSTVPLRRALEGLGYAAHGWGCGFNMGMRPHVKRALRQRLEQLHERFESKISLIGWSLGGVFVREMARAQPELVRRVITLGSPINGHPNANNLAGLFRLANRGRPVRTDVEGFLKRREPPPVPCTAIYSRRDGIVDWRCAREPATPRTDNVEVRGSHLGLIFNREVLRTIAQRLAENEN